MSVQRVVLFLRTGRLEMLVTHWKVSGDLITFYDRKEVLGQFSLKVIDGWALQAKVKI